MRRLAARRPVVALVVGRHDVGAFAASHTGALATSWRTTRAALAQAGAVLVDDERELVDAVGALSLTPAAPGADPGVGVVTAQAGPGLLLLDDLRGRGPRVPELAPATRDTLATLLPPLTYQRNPVDTGRPGPELRRGARAPSPPTRRSTWSPAYALHEPDAVDLVAAAAGRGRASSRWCSGSAAPGADVGAVRAGAARRRDRGRRPTRAAWPRRSVRCSPTPAPGPAPREPAAAAAAAAPGSPAPHDEAPGQGAARRGSASPTTAAPGLRRPGRRRTPALAELGGPVAVKLLDAAVLHKTEIGGVHLGVAHRGRARRGARRASTRSAPRRYLVERWRPPGVDLVVGARRDPVFGPVVLLGLGGTDRRGARRRRRPARAAVRRRGRATMPDDLAGRALLDGWRGGPVLDRAELGRVVAALGDLLVANPDLDEIEINPLRLTADGLRRPRRRRHPEPRRPPMASPIS